MAKAQKLFFPVILNKNNMKSTPNDAVTSNQTKALSVVIACIACSLLISMTVVTYVVKWLMQS